MESRALLSSAHRLHEHGPRIRFAVYAAGIATQPRMRTPRRRLSAGLIHPAAGDFFAPPPPPTCGPSTVEVLMEVGRPSPVLATLALPVVALRRQRFTYGARERIGSLGRQCFFLRVPSY
jgi:hypothetical protein